MSKNKVQNLMERMGMISPISEDGGNQHILTALTEYNFQDLKDIIIEGAQEYDELSLKYVSDDSHIHLTVDGYDYEIIFNLTAYVMDDSDIGDLQTAPTYNSHITNVEVTDLMVFDPSMDQILNDETYNAMSLIIKDKLES